MRDEQKKRDFAITEDGQVWQLRDGKMGFLLGHIGCLLEDAKRRPTSTNLAVRDWWQAFLSSDMPLAAYIPEVEVENPPSWCKQCTWYVQNALDGTYDRDNMKDLMELFEAAA